ncbi:YdaS family helix-turn-helix protein [Comamonas sp.]|uniref:YdaS family helix-turn-helix protein n=1 Tax=Comamonas sp. TaxID=34028 RepID=UPI00289DD6EC|nr:YdaS family helix-turn-helix protein [Comamonas sp.]
MNLKNYLFTKDKQGRIDFAASCGTTLGHLTNVANGYRAASVELAVLIEQQSGGEVTRQELFPDRYARMWPELGLGVPVSNHIS